MKCTVCEFVFHAKCESVTPQQFSLFRELDKLKAPFEWLCSTCRKVDVMNIMKTMHLMQNKIENLEKEVASLKQRNPSHENNTENVLSSQSSSQNSSVSDAVNEALDIERRKFNLVISGMPVRDDISDVELVQSLLEDPVLDVTGTVHINDVRRIGNKGLMIISFDSMESKRSVLKSAHRLRSSTIAAHKDIYISPDLTRQQRQAEYNLRIELRRRKDNGETGLKISKGKIVQTSVQPQSSTTPHVIRVVTGGRMVPQSPDFRGHIQNALSNSSSGKVTQQRQSHIVTVADVASKLSVAGGSRAPEGASGTVRKN